MKMKTLSAMRWSRFFGQVVKVDSAEQEALARKRRRFTAEFKARVALEALRERDSVQAIAARHELHPNQVTTWKRQLLEGLPEVFAGGAGRKAVEHEAKSGPRSRGAHGGAGFFSLKR